MQLNDDLATEMAKVRGGDDRGSNEQEDDEEKQRLCEAQRRDTHTKALNKATFENNARNLFCLAQAPLTGPIGFFACGAANTAGLAAQVATANLVLEDCLAICRGEEPKTECFVDSDCKLKEYCFKGPIGLGANECRHKKEDGKVCSRSGKCLSGCCKYHVLSHPFAMVCRPADRCS